MLRATVFGAMVLAANAECPNACSGHGLCRENDECKCDPNYMGADCSLRVCPFDVTFVDTPRGDLNHNGLTDSKGNVPVQWSNTKEYEVFPYQTDVYNAQANEAHFYAECSGKGECDRETGECKCYNGYTGAACQRTSCPKDCSGHGVCRTMKEIAAGALNKREVASFAGHKYYTGFSKATTYNLWDADKQQACVCDPGYTGIDCSMRQCARGDDPLTTDSRWCGGATCTWEVQSFKLSASDSTTFKIGFKDSLGNDLYAYATVNVLSGTPGAVTDTKNYLPSSTTVAGQIMQALRDVPGGLLQRVEVYAKSNNKASDPDYRTYTVTFVGVPGNQNQLTISTSAGPGSLDGSITTVADGNYESIECSGRGLCDSSAGLCKCFTGYFGAACEYQNALA